jgi:hypothetical protein
MGKTRLRVLLLNWSLAARGGTEAAIRDIALGLRRLDHAPIVYSPELGPISKEIEAAGIPVVDNLALVGDKPDIIHTHHYFTTGEALIHFPDVPAVHVCHGWSPGLERPPKFPQIRRYIAISECTRDNIVNRQGISPEITEILYNAVDLTRVPPRVSRLPEKPETAVAFMSRAHAQIMPALQNACTARGIRFRTIGEGHDNPSPERELIDQELVFATGRSASEALAAGCAVVVVDSNGLGDFVTTANYDRFRRHNFALRSLVNPVSVEALGEAIDRYDQRQAEDAARLHRLQSDFGNYIENIVTHYNWAIDDYRAHPPTPQDVRKATQKFLHAALPRLVNAAGEHEKRPVETNELSSGQSACELELMKALAELQRTKKASMLLEGQLITARNALHETLLTFHASTSWRISAPVRWLGRHLRR